MGTFVDYQDTIFKGFNILVVEDDKESYNFLEAILTEYGAFVYEANNGLEAIETVNSNKIHLILMDVRMPIMDGFEATKAIKKSHPEVPVIIQTAFGLADDDIMAIESGCDDFITKPVQHDQLINIISNYLLNNDVYND